LKIPRLILAGTTSGVGKTSISCAIIFGLKKRGYSVQPFKVGPDYIDPSYLSSISGNDTCNLDVWLMGKKELEESFLKNSRSDISIIEGVMGYYDGFSGKSSFSSTYHVATILQAPVILVLDASKTARSIAATALGYKKFHRNSRIVGFILNKIGSEKHEMLCRQALEPLRTPILGSVPNDPKFSFASRHLGLIHASEKDLKAKIRVIAKKISEHLEIDKLIKIANNVPVNKKIHLQKRKNSKTTIAVALDNSFNFYYNDNLEALRREGAKIVYFSPIKDKKLPNCDGLFLGGGYPEVLASSLEKNQKMLKMIKKLAENETPIYAECGGLMYLTKSIDYGNKKFRMVGLFDAETLITKKMKLNYTKGTFSTNCLISKQNKMLHGHEFHYSEINSVSSDSKFAYQLSIGDGIKNKKDGLIAHSVLASYGHLYFDSSTYAKHFVENCSIRSRK